MSINGISQSVDFTPKVTTQQNAAVQQPLLRGLLEPQADGIASFFPGLTLPEPNMASGVGTTPSSLSLESLWETLGAAKDFGQEVATSHGQQNIGLLEGLTQLEEIRQSLGYLDMLAGMLLGSGQQASQTPQQAAALAELASLPPEVLFNQVGTLASQYTFAQGQSAVVDLLASQLGFDASDIAVLDSAGSLLGIGNGSSGAEAAAAPFSTTASNLVGMIGAGYSAYQLIDNWGKNTPVGGAIQGATTGAYIGTKIFPGVGTAIGTLLGGLAGGLFGSIKSGKHKDQQARDAVRDYFQDIQLIDRGHNLELANGEQYFIGHDGRHTYENLDGTTRRPYNPDPSNPLTGQTIGFAQPLAAILMGGDEKLRTDFTGYFVNAALSNASDIETARENVLKIFEKMQITPETAVQALVDLHRTGKLNDNELLAYVNGVRQLLTGQGYSADQLPLM